MAEMPRPFRLLASSLSQSKQPKVPSIYIPNSMEEKFLFWRLGFVFVICGMII